MLRCERSEGRGLHRRGRWDAGGVAYQKDETVGAIPLWLPRALRRGQARGPAPTDITIPQLCKATPVVVGLLPVGIAGNWGVDRCRWFVEVRHPAGGCCR
jgi:hypothetical protein